MMNIARRCAPLLTTIVCLLLTMLVQPRASYAARVDVWGAKPVLAYFVFNPQFRDQLRHDLALSDLELTAIEQIAIRESEQLRALNQESRAIIAADGLTLEQRRAEIERIEYNDRLLATLADGQDALVAALGSTQERALVAWIERQWAVEQQEHGVSNVSVASRTYRVFATQYAGETVGEVSLPDKCLKFANRGWADASCPISAYGRRQNYSVQLGYNSRSTTSLVWDVGPWNEDDTYWLSPGDAQYRRVFPNLPQGLPQAQAAYFNGYNGGRDQFGRIVGNPGGIDLGDGVRLALGLGYLENVWLDVTYLWTNDPEPVGAPLPKQRWMWLPMLQR